MKTTKLFMAALIAATMFSSCGSEGPTGPTGPTGGPGANGLNGAANVTVNTATIAAGTGVGGWTQSVSSPNVYYSQFNASAITDFTSDVVVAYVQGTASSTSDFYALPVTNFYANNDAMSFSYNNNLVTFYYVFTVGTTVVPPVPFTVKIAVIPPGVMKQHPGLNPNDYHAVMSIVNQQNASASK